MYVCTYLIFGYEWNGCISGCERARTRSSKWNKDRIKIEEKLKFWIATYSFIEYPLWKILFISSIVRQQVHKFFFIHCHYIQKCLIEIMYKFWVSWEIIVNSKWFFLLIQWHSIIIVLIKSDWMKLDNTNSTLEYFRFSMYIGIYT